MHFPERIVTARLVLRAIRATDVDQLAEVYADEQTMRLVGGIRSRSQVCDEIAHVVAGYEFHGLGPRAVLNKADVLLGRCGLEPTVVGGAPEIELGYLFARHAWGRGYATEAATAVCDAAWALGIRRLVAVVEEVNAKSAAVAERIGMRLERHIVRKGVRARVYVAASPESAG